MIGGHVSVIAAPSARIVAIGEPAGRRSEYLLSGLIRVTNLRAALAVAVAVAASNSLAAQQPVPAGRIKVTSGVAFVRQQSGQVPAKVGLAVYESDTLTTGADGRIGVTLRDETRIALGPQSEVRLDRFQYAPAEGQLAFVMRIAQGLATYVSGRIAKLSPDAVRLETPAAVVGVRGTHLAIRVSPQP